MYEVHLKSFPKARVEHIERVVHKHNRAMTHHEYAHLVGRVAKGEPQLVASYHEVHVADNLVLEFAYHDADAEVRELEA